MEITTAYRQGWSNLANGELRRFLAVFDGWMCGGQPNETQIKQDRFTANEFRQWAKL